MEQSLPKQVLYGIGRAVDTVPEWHARRFLKLYDKLYTSKLSDTEKAAADAVRPIIEKRAKLLGWVATGLEATVLTYLTAKGFSALKNTLKQNSAHAAPDLTVPTEPPLMKSIAHEVVRDIPPSGTIHELDGILRIQEGEEAVHAQIADGLVSSKGGSVFHNVDRFLEDAPEIFVPHEDGARIVTTQTYRHDHQEALVNVTRVTGKGGWLDYLFNIVYTQRPYQTVVRIRRDHEQDPLVGYLVTAKQDGTPILEFVRGIMPSDGFVGKWMAREGYTARPLSHTSLQNVEQWMIEGSQKDYLAKKRLAVLEKLFNSKQ